MTLKFLKTRFKATFKRNVNYLQFIYFFNFYLFIYFFYNC